MVFIRLARLASFMLSCAELAACGGSVSALSGEGGSDASAPGCDGRTPIPPDAGVPRPEGCSFRDDAAAFPMFDKCCATSDDCAVGVYEFLCCGDTFAMGFNKSQVGAFQATVAQWNCEGCGCPNGGQLTEDGVKGRADAGVRCDDGWCMTYAQ